MRIGVLGTGTVGRTLASALLSDGHEVRLGSRSAGNEAAVAWAAGIGGPASEGTFADAAGFGELVVNATAGAASLDALNLAGAEQLSGKVLVDVANPLGGVRPCGLGPRRADRRRACQQACSAHAIPPDLLLAPSGAIGNWLMRPEREALLGRGQSGRH